MPRDLDFLPPCLPGPNAKNAMVSEEWPVESVRDHAHGRRTLHLDDPRGLIAQQIQGGE